MNYLDVLKPLRWQPYFTDSESDELPLPLRRRHASIILVDLRSAVATQNYDIHFINALLEVMKRSPQHTYLLFVPMKEIIANAAAGLHWPQNAWLGLDLNASTSLEEIDHFYRLKALKRFVVADARMEHIEDLHLDTIDWIVLTSSEEEPSHPDTVHNIAQSAMKSQTPLFFEGWRDRALNPNPADPTMHRLHRYYSKGGCQIDGSTYRFIPPRFSRDQIEIFGTSFDVMDRIDDMITIWELKSYLPFPSGKKYEEIKSDIRTNGIIDPVLFWTTPDKENLVIEGHTRIRAALELGIEHLPSKRVYEDFHSLEDIQLWIVRHQLQRRNLSNIERLIYAYKSKEAIERLAKENIAKAASKAVVGKRIDTYSELANIAGVGRATVVRYHDVLTHGSQHLIHQMHEGKVSVYSAYTKVKKKRSDQKAPDKKGAQIILFDNIEDALTALQKGDVADVLITSSNRYDHILKKRSSVHVGVVLGHS